MKPLTYMPVEGVYSPHGHWQHVILCSGCLRVVARISHVEKIGGDGEYTWHWTAQSPPSSLCLACGFFLWKTKRPNGGHIWAIKVATARWHTQFDWTRPWSTWGAGHWEVRDFEKIRTEVEEKT